MHFSGMSLTSALLCFLLHVLARDYFFPDGSVVQEEHYLRCRPEYGPHSACCAAGDGCSATGLCFGNAGFMYRGACTDQAWTAQECPQHCQNGTSIP